MIKIVCDDCINALNYIDKESVDLIVTSPPYNVNLGDNANSSHPENVAKDPYDNYHDNKPYEEYLLFLEERFRVMYDILKDSGRIVINIGDKANGRICTHGEIYNFMTKKLSYLCMNTIIWDKDQVVSRTSWGSYTSPSCPSFPTPFEFILIFAKKDFKLQSLGESDITPEEFKKWSYATWKFKAESRKKIGHPAPFPIELPLRCMKMLSWKNSVVMDPFMGSGTTGVACKLTGRDFIGFDISDKYCQFSKRRIDSFSEDIDIFDSANKMEDSYGN
jgi:site-specific DNA-methyltransferase (adenine-specific)